MKPNIIVFGCLVLFVWGFIFHVCSAGHRTGLLPFFTALWWCWRLPVCIIRRTLTGELPKPLTRCILNNLLFLGCTHMMRRACWCAKQLQNVAQVLHNSRIKYPRDFFSLYRHQEFQFPLWYAVHLGRENELQVLNGSHIFVSFTRILLLFGTKFQYSRKRRQGEERKQSDKAAIRDLVLTFCPTLRSV